MPEGLLTGAMLATAVAEEAFWVGYRATRWVDHNVIG